MGNSLAPKVVEENVGELDKSNRLEVGLFNFDSHNNGTVAWTDILEVLILLIMMLAVIRVLMKCWKKRNERRMQAMGNTVANMMASTQPPSHSVQMTTLPVLRSARGPTIRELEPTTTITRAIQGPNVTAGHLTPSLNYEPWRE